MCGEVDGNFNNVVSFCTEIITLFCNKDTANPNDFPILGQLKQLPIFKNLSIEQFLDLALIQLANVANIFFKRSDLGDQVTELIEKNSSTLISEVKDEYLKIRLMFLFGNVADVLFSTIDKAN